MPTPGASENIQPSPLEFSVERKETTAFVSNGHKDKAYPRKTLIWEKVVDTITHTTIYYRVFQIIISFFTITPIIQAITIEIYSVQVILQKLSYIFHTSNIGQRLARLSHIAHTSNTGDTAIAVHGCVISSIRDVWKR